MTFQNSYARKLSGIYAKYIKWVAGANSRNFPKKERGKKKEERN